MKTLKYTGEPVMKYLPKVGFFTLSENTPQPILQSAHEAGIAGVVEDSTPKAQAQAPKVEMSAPKADPNIVKS